MYPWYELVDNEAPLAQGDFISSCPIIVPPKEPLIAEIGVNVKEYEVIIMSQSCDLVARKIDLVLVCPWWTLAELGEASSEFKNRGGKEKLRQGHIVGLHLLNKCDLQEVPDQDFRVVNFREVYSVDLEYIEYIARKAGPRLRLLPPYREHLSQAFSRFFMRVGLPVDIPKF